MCNSQTVPLTNGACLLVIVAGHWVASLSRNCSRQSGNSHSSCWHATSLRLGHSSHVHPTAARDVASASSIALASGTSLRLCSGQSKSQSLQKNHLPRKVVICSFVKPSALRLVLFPKQHGHVVFIPRPPLSLSCHQLPRTISQAGQ